MAGLVPAIHVLQQNGMEGIKLDRAHVGAIYYAAIGKIPSPYR
jgi:hypothetical protein